MFNSHQPLVQKSQPDTFALNEFRGRFTSVSPRILPYWVQTVRG